MAISAAEANMIDEVGRSFGIGAKELTQTDIKEFKARAIIAGIQTAQARSIATSPKAMVVRHALPFTDFGNGGLGWLTENYITGVIATTNAWASAFSAGALPANAPTLAQTKVAVFYKFADTMANPVVTGVRFLEGQNGATTKATYFIQQPTEGNLEPDIFFTSPIVYEPQDILFIQIYNTVAIAVGETIPFEAYVVERRGPTVS